MLAATVALARRIERAEIDFCAAAAGVGVPGGASVVQAGGGCGLYGRPGSPFNKVLGLGVGCAVSDEDLDALDEFYDEHQCAVQIELCPLVAPDLPPRLEARGYALRAFENELARELNGPAGGVPPAPESGGEAIRVETVSDALDDTWLTVVAEGFASADALADGPADREAVASLREVMGQFRHPAIARYLAWVGEHPAGGGAAYVHDGTLGIFGTATLPAFRRRGVQRAIAGRAIEDGSAGADLAIATTEPGSASQRTFERLGFQVMYTRAILIRDLDLRNLRESGTAAGSR